MIAGFDMSSMVERSTASGWALCIIGLFGIWRLYVLGRPKMRELEITESDALRQAFVEEMKALRDEIKGLREENGNLRQEVRELHHVIDGMRRENLAANISTQSALMESLPDDIVPPATRSALARLKGVGK